MSLIDTKAIVTSLAVKLPPPDTVRLTIALQTTLELDELMAVFAREAGAHVPFDGLTLRAPARGVECRVGNRATHRCAYNITLLDEALAEIEFTREQRFGESDLAQLEVFLSTLAYPLRNAFTYHTAVQASRKDFLTLVGNRAAFEEAVNREVQLARRQRLPLALLTIDLDHFKRVNDTHGHLAGDAVLRATAQRLLGATRNTDQVFRYGGEEFVVLLNNTDEAGALLVAERIRRAIEAEPIGVRGTSLQVTTSIGLAVLGEATDASALFAAADQALYCAKAQGRNCVAAYSGEAA